ncbi:MAG: shikimate dehydrogenase [Acidimicrobiales bacterium]|nr:shikimate dehydrogenase [Acidimicrobiales bacterium]MYG60382.1 shikimate dehydrogenase [Acidimicrobiales bacterium]MYJ47723.1 shikimate dehydrogenase [Acidimicrobiales bacterium]
MVVPTGSTRVAGVIGDPVRHSLSPALHNAAFAELGLDWTYLAFEVPVGRGADAVAAMRALGIEGLSVTMPHKDTVAAAVDELSPAAALLGAANCVRRDGDRLIGENTDGAGFLRSLRTQAGVDPAGLRTVVLGAGGAARAVIVALAAEGALVTVVNRSPDAAARAAALGAEAGGATAEALGGRSGSASVGGAEAARDADVVVNATPLGMTDSDPLPVDPALLSDSQIVVDLIYRPERTPLLEAAAEAGATTLNGVGMLLYQAAEQFTMWTGHDAPVDAMAAAVGLDLAGS